MYSVLVPAVGEELPFEPRDIVIHTDRWVTDDYALSEILGRWATSSKQPLQAQTLGVN